MAERLLPPAWPRLDVDEAQITAARIFQLTPDDAGESVSTSVEGLRFYPTAPTRVTKSDLDALRAEVIDLAEHHGFPGNRDLRAKPSFDQELAVLFARSMPMLPVEASDDEIWAFLTLKVLPDVAIWRWPASEDADELEIGEDDPARPQIATRMDRFLGRRRGVFRQAWWRAHLLGAERCTRLDEDNFINLTDRISLTGDARIAPIVVDTHLRLVSEPGYDRRYGLRRALVLIGRLFGRLAVEALSDDEVRGLIEDAFSKAIDSSHDEEQIMMIEPADVPATERLLTLAPQYAEILRPLLAVISHQRAVAMASAAADYVKTLNGDPLAVRISDDLNELVDDWHAFEDDERVVIHAALAYFLEEHDATADVGPDGLIDDDEVVNAAFEALGRERNLG